MRFIDLAFAKRLEMVSAVSCQECTEALRLSAPHALAAWECIAGGIAAFSGVDSPVTQAFGVGLDGPVDAGELDRLEDFFFSRGATVALELCPFIDPSLVVLLAQRAYRLQEFSNVLVRDLGAGESFHLPEPAVTVRPAEPHEAKLYTRVVTDGFAEQIPVSQSLLEVLEGFFHRSRGRAFFAILDGEVAGGATVAAHDGIAEMSGAATLPQFRNRGVQAALIGARLAWGAAHGCSLATTTTGPATSSQRNFERAGFQVVYSRTKVVRNKENS